MRMYKTKLNPKIARLAKGMGVEFRIAEKPEDVGISGAKMAPHEVAAYFGQGVIFVKAKTKYPPSDLDFIFLHELGHAIIVFFLDESINRKAHEIKANAVALGFSAAMGLPVSERMLKNCALCTKAHPRNFKGIKVKHVKRWSAIAFFEPL